jgi:hypothetical protein
MPCIQIKVFGVERLSILEILISEYYAQSIISFSQSIGELKEFI